MARDDAEKRSPVGIVLAAAPSRQTLATDSSVPCALLKIAEETVIERHVRILLAAGIERLVIVTGQDQSLIGEHVRNSFGGRNMRIVHNAEYATVNR